MINLLQEARARGEAAMKRAVWGFAAAGLLVIAAGFVAAGAVAGLMEVAPAWAAFAIGALPLLALALFCLARARGPNANAAVEGALRLDEGMHPANDADWRTLLDGAIAAEAREKPARAAAIAAIAGLILGAIEALDAKPPA